MSEQTSGLSSGSCIVQFHAPWCGPCRTLHPIVEEVAGDFSGEVSVVRIDVDRDESAAVRWKVRGVPTLLALNDGREVARLTGARTPEQVRSLFRAAQGQEMPTTGKPSLVRPLIAFLGMGLTLTPHLDPAWRPLSWVGIALVLWGMQDACPMCSVAMRPVAKGMAVLGKILRRR
ncbi:MAG: thioredoxin family protein [Fibrobacteria bacterium]|nr:thioredoxin family protein [Fibrobacteria bacterium]